MALTVALASIYGFYRSLTNNSTKSVEETKVKLGIEYFFLMEMSWVYAVLKTGKKLDDLLSMSSSQMRTV